MAGRIATITGTMLTPGVSRNKRLYSRDLIARAAKRMQERISDPDGLPIVMRTHHEAGDDSRKIVGRLTGVKVGEDGSASYSADLYDTAPGRDIAALITGKAPALKSVSIHGYWLGPVKRVSHEGESVTTAEDLEIDAVDFTASPGVLGATVAAASYLPDAPPAAESTAGRTPISESVEATVEPVTEEAPVDEGYNTKQRRKMASAGQAMDDGSYPIKTKADLRRAIRAVGRGGADHDAIRKHIVARAAALGLSRMIPDNWNKDGSMKESDTRYSDVREYYDGPGGAAGFCIDAYNGPTSITIRNCSIDPAELRVIAAAAMDAVVNALQALDPDMDADVDVDGALHADTDDDMTSGSESGVGKDDDMESAPAAGSAAAVEAGRRAGEPLTEADVSALAAARDAGAITPDAVITPQVLAEAHALTETAPPAQGAATTNTEEEAAMGEPTTETRETEAAPARSLTDADISALGALFGASLKEAMAPITAALAEKAPESVATKATETAEAKPAKEAKESKKARKAALKETVAELKASFDAQLAEALTKQRDELRETLLKENGLPPRQGYRVHENDKAPDTAEDLFEDRANLLLGAIGIPAAPQTAAQ